MSDRNRLGVLRRAGLLGIGVALVAAAAPAVSFAAVTPASLTNCSGKLSKDSTGSSQGEPNLLDYSFSCDTDISAYTILLDRRASDFANIDDYNPAPSVLQADGVTPSTTESLTCEGVTPSNGINCNAGAGGVLSSGFFADGSIDPTQPYCKYLPPKAKPGTLAIPQAIVELVVTDNTGAEDGPFQLKLSGCPKVPNVAPAPKTKKSKGKSKGKKKGSTGRASARR